MICRRRWFFHFFMFIYNILPKRPVLIRQVIVSHAGTSTYKYIYIRRVRQVENFDRISWYIMQHVRFRIWKIIPPIICFRRDLYNVIVFMHHHLLLLLSYRYCSSSVRLSVCHGKCYICRISFLEFTSVIWGPAAVSVQASVAVRGGMPRIASRRSTGSRRSVTSLTAIREHEQITNMPAGNNAPCGRERSQQN